MIARKRAASEPSFESLSASTRISSASSSGTSSAESPFEGSTAFPSRAVASTFSTRFAARLRGDEQAVPLGAPPLQYQNSSPHMPASRCLPGRRPQSLLVPALRDRMGLARRGLGSGRPPRRGASQAHSDGAAAVFELSRPARATSRLFRPRRRRRERGRGAFRVTVARVGSWAANGRLGGGDSPMTREKPDGKFARSFRMKGTFGLGIVTSTPLAFKRAKRSSAQMSKTICGSISRTETAQSVHTCRTNVRIATGLCLPSDGMRRRRPTAADRDRRASRLLRGDERGRRRESAGGRPRTQ